MLYCLIKNILGPKSYLKWKFYVPKLFNQEENQVNELNIKILQASLQVKELTENNFY